MASHQLRQISAAVYFVTFTCHKWLPLIKESNSFAAFDKWYTYLPQKDIKLLGYVIMPNHFHAILSFSDATTISLNALIANAKRFLAYEIVKNLEAQKNEALLWQMHSSITASEKVRGKKHKVFITSFDSVVVQDIAAVQKILAYIHNNPCVKKWHLAESPEDYEYSSARFYLCGVQHKYLTDYRDVYS